MAMARTTPMTKPPFSSSKACNLPIDNLEPFLDARLLSAEKQRLAAMIEARVTTRKPLPYLLNKAYIQGVPFYVDERVIVPRSYIGELMAGEMFAGNGNSLIPDPDSVESVLDLCTGSGCLAILAAMRFENAQVCATDLSKTRLKSPKSMLRSTSPTAGCACFKATFSRRSKA